MDKWYFKQLTTSVLLAQATAAAPTEQALKGILKAGMESEGNEMNDEQILISATFFHRQAPLRMVLE